MPHARFTRGSTMKHIAVMSMSNAIGITALFVVDMLDLFFLSLLGEKHLAAAVGYAGTILFLTTSVGIGLSIGAAALVSRAIGERNRPKARRYMMNVIALSLMISSVIAIATWTHIPDLLTAIGAKGMVKELATSYLRIMIPSMPVLAMAMCFGAGLRAVGDARRSMSSTLAGGAVNAILDPIFIFVLDMGIEGAALASVFARITILAVSAYGVIGVHGLFCGFKWYRFRQDYPAIVKIAFPAILTNLAMPFSSAFITRSMAEFGDSFVAGYAIIGRLIPVAFGIVFALSGAIGPIIGQNYGARNISRVRESLINAYLFSSAYILTASFVVFLFQDYLVQMFNAKEEAALLVHFFCNYIAVTFLFNGLLFIANATFNNLGKPNFSALLNWGKATFGTIPFVIVGTHFSGAYGVLIGSSIGGILFSLSAVWLSIKLVNSLGIRAGIQEKIITTEPALEPEEVQLPCALNPLSSDCAQMCQISEEAECEQHLLEEVND